MIPTRGHEINGSRPPSLKVVGESHSIKKSTSSNVVGESHSIKKSTSSNVVKQQRRLGRGAPVIIYTHSPKVIHTRAEDFMALVQRLTGLDAIIRRNPNDATESSSVVTEEVNVGDDDMTVPFSQVRQQRRNLSDIPLFTPSSMTLFGSPTQRLYMSPNRTNPV